MEIWKGGFDLPFLRTRLSHHEREWPFAELPYIDVMEVFSSRFNTSDNSLTGVYDELVASGHGTIHLEKVAKPSTRGRLAISKL